MKQSTFFLVMCIPGAIIPYALGLGFLTIPGWTVPLFFQLIFANPVSSAFASDLILSCVVFFGLVFYEGRRLNMKRLWIYVPAVVIIGLSFGLPLFLYFRAKRLEHINPA